MLTSTLPRFPGDIQAGFVAEQTQAWLVRRPEDEIIILAPHDPAASRREVHGRLTIQRFRYFLPTRFQKLAYPAIIPNIRRSRLLVLQIPFFLIAQYCAAKRLLRAKRADVIYAHWVMPQGLVAWRLSRRFKIPFVLQNHSSDLRVFDHLGSVGRRIAGRLLRDCTRFFCVNAAQLADARLMVPPEGRAAFNAKALSLPMGLSPPLNAGTQDSLGFDIATIARLSRKKGIHLLIEAAERLAERGIRPRIGIAGDGEDRVALEGMVRHANITFTGFLVGEEKERFLASARRFAFPAKAAVSDVEGLPVALLEALSRGRPVLASRDTNIEMLPEWERLRSFVTFIPDPAQIDALADGLEVLLTADAAKAAAAAPIAARYRWDRLIEEYLEPILTAVKS